MCRCGTTHAARVIDWSRCTRAAPEWILARWPLTWKPPLAAFPVYTPEQRGHGHTPDVEGPITLVGCSDGAVLALTVALRRPDLVRRLVFAADVFHRGGWEDGVLDSDPPGFLRQGYGDARSRVLLTHDDLGRIGCRTLAMVDDDDEVRLEHAVDLHRSLPDAELSVVPGTSHGLLAEKPELCNMVITEFITKDPVRTFAPIGRAASR